MKNEQTWSSFSKKNSRLDRNQDAYLFRNVSYRGKSIQLAVVADGVGGHGNGFRASQLVIDYIIRYWNLFISQLNVIGLDYLICREMITKAVEEANLDLFQSFMQSGQLDASTCTVLLIDKKELYLLHIGDTRVYRINKSIEQLTMDHRILATTILTKCIGMSETLKMDKICLKRKRKDRFLLATDGFYSLFEHAEFKSIGMNSALESKRKYEAVLNTQSLFDDATFIICY